jgi:hypothetical protein
MGASSGTNELPGIALIIDARRARTAGPGASFAVVLSRLRDAEALLGGGCSGGGGSIPGKSDRSGGGQCCVGYFHELTSWFALAKTGGEVFDPHCVYSLAHACRLRKKSLRCDNML